jgi:hypothetical protein
VFQISADSLPASADAARSVSRHADGTGDDDDEDEGCSRVVLLPGRTPARYYWHSQASASRRVDTVVPAVDTNKCDMFA